jgi:hypothetical protein
VILVAIFVCPQSHPGEKKKIENVLAAHATYWKNLGLISANKQQID